MGVSMESEIKDCVSKAAVLSPKTLNRNCRRAGFYAVLMAVVGFKYEVFDLIINSMHRSSVVIDHFMVFLTGAMLAMGLMLLYGGRTAPRSLEPDKYSGKFGLAALIVASLPVVTGIILDLYVNQSVTVCLKGSFFFQ